MLPWLNNNVGILETTIKNSETPEPLKKKKKIRYRIHKFKNRKRRKFKRLRK